jgi:hypothetical protein
MSGALQRDPLWAALKLAEHFDPTIRIAPHHWPRLLRRYVAPLAYCRETLFTRMYQGEPSVLAGFPKPLRRPFASLDPQAAGPALIGWLGHQQSRRRHSINGGPGAARKSLTLAGIAAKWQAGSARFGVTDLHIRNTVMEQVIAPQRLSEFNLLTRSSEDARRQEMFSFVISTRGHVTDSHSDAPDSSNFCFTGRKLWLAWDTYEGARRGLQDVERLPTAARAGFDMDSWLGLRSARWLLVNPGETLFLPANLTHKVVTLESYVGVGGFFIALPNCLRLLSHWIMHVPLWSKLDKTGAFDGLVDEIAGTAEDALHRLRRAPSAQRRRWAYDYVRPAAAYFLATQPKSNIRRLLSDSRFRRVAEAIPLKLA